MTSRIQGITVEIGGDTTKLSTALSKVNKEIRDTQSQLKDVNKLLKLDPGNANMRSVVQGKNADSFMYCPTGRMHRDSPCDSVRIRRDVAERALMGLVRKQAELLVSAEQVLKEKRKQRAGKQGMDAGDVKAEMKRLDGCKISDYESYKAGKMTKEMFLERKKVSDMKRRELTAVLAEMEAQEIVEEDSSREFGKALGIKEYLHLEEYDKAVMASLIVSAKVMGEDRLEVTWKHQDIYEKILGEMQG